MSCGSRWRHGTAWSAAPPCLPSASLDVKPCAVPTPAVRRHIADATRSASGCKCPADSAARSCGPGPDGAVTCVHRAAIRTPTSNDRSVAKNKQPRPRKPNRPRVPSAAAPCHLEDPPQDGERALNSVGNGHTAGELHHNLAQLPRRLSPRNRLRRPHHQGSARAARHHSHQAATRHNGERALNAVASRLTDGAPNRPPPTDPSDPWRRGCRLRPQSLPPRRPNLQLHPTRPGRGLTPSPRPTAHSPARSAQDHCQQVAIRRDAERVPTAAARRPTANGSQSAEQGPHQLRFPASPCLNRYGRRRSQDWSETRSIETGQG